jgi:hypothetical protein
VAEGSNDNTDPIYGPTSAVKLNDWLAQMSLKYADGGMKIQFPIEGVTVYVPAGSPLKAYSPQEPVVVVPPWLPVTVPRILSDAAATLNDSGVAAIPATDQYCVKLPMFADDQDPLTDQFPFPSV